MTGVVPIEKMLPGLLEGVNVTIPQLSVAVINGIDRFHLAQAAVDRVPALAPRRAEFRDFVASKLALHDAYIREHGEDMPEIRDWKWQAS